MRLKCAIVIVALAAACGSETSSTMLDLASGDLAGADLAGADLAMSIDFARAGDLAMQACGAAGCRSFSNYCEGCACLALPTNAPDPVCMGNMVSCLVDPCDGRAASCSGGVCTLQ